MTPRILATGLRFPEGPVALADGSIACVELAAGRVIRWRPDGTVSLIAETGGGPNGLAIGSDGAFYVCDNGGNLYRPGHFASIGVPADFTGGAILRIAPDDGPDSLAVTTLVDRCGPHRLSAPNDLVFDAAGGCYFSDIGKKHARHRDHGGVYYASADGSVVREVAYPMTTPNGVGLSPDGGILYVAETETCRLWAFDLEGPGRIRASPPPSPQGGRLLCTLPGLQRFDSLALQADGAICVATLLSGCISVIAPDGRLLRQVAMPGAHPTNLCFAAPDLRTAIVTVADTGQLVALEWPSPGLKLLHQQTRGHG